MKTESAIFEQLRTVLAEITANEPVDILPESDLVDDLGIIPETDLPRIVKRVNAEFEIMLDQKIVMAEVETVADLLTRITDEVELG
jgi:acyl carrier protein